MIFGEYSGDESDAKGEIGLVVASIYEPGDVANVIYYSGTKPLALVPNNFFILKPNDAAGLSNSQRLKRRTIFVVGENVEFELVPGSDRIVQWIRKHPEIIDVCLSAEINKFVAKSTGIIPPPSVKRDSFWTKEFDWISFEPELLRDYGEVSPEVPMVITISIDISFGDHENASIFNLDDFKPWKQMPDLVPDHDLTVMSAEISMKSEEEYSGQPEPSQSANRVGNKRTGKTKSRSTQRPSVDSGVVSVYDKTEMKQTGQKEPAETVFKSEDVFTQKESKKLGGKAIRPSVDSGVASVLSGEISDASGGNLSEHRENSQEIQQDCVKEPLGNHKGAGCAASPPEFNAGGDGNRENIGLITSMGDLLISLYKEGYCAGLKGGHQV
ncbi:hypothetical protein DdX_18527 [Ditylenchus destructor]|uniref:Uncharacterized protein n=1 Tax=Ditylenchus destructor TaxID=166010 RepID=A0AAD4QST2_9BILA|nr:hypothetical protein DdX_18527 [Ditylenchus destructor]